MPPTRCEWTGADDLMVRYHDTEWGVPVSDDRKLFEFIVLEGAQAGLSWTTILRRRENYRKAFDGFDPVKVARYGEEEIAGLLADPGIIRNRLKVRSAVSNAAAFLEVAAEFGSFSRYMWGFVDGRPVMNGFRAMSELPATSAVSDLMSRDMKRRGFSFVGSTICYAHMESVGMVNDHVTHCFRYPEIEAMAAAFEP
jgi:DNA-3-methyladenine glycosylase I